MNSEDSINMNEFLNKEISLLVNKTFVYMSEKIAEHFNGKMVTKEEIDEFIKKELNVDDIKFISERTTRKRRENRPRETKQCAGVMRNGRQCSSMNCTKASNYTLCPNCQNKEKNKKKSKEEQTCGKFNTDVPNIFTKMFNLLSITNIDPDQNLFLHTFENNESLEKIQILICEKNDTYYAISEISCNEKKRIEDDMKEHLIQEGYDVLEKSVSEDDIDNEDDDEDNNFEEENSNYEDTTNENSESLDKGKRGSENSEKAHSSSNNFNVYYKNNTTDVFPDTRQKKTKVDEKHAANVKTDETNNIENKKSPTNSTKKAVSTSIEKSSQSTTTTNKKSPTSVSKKSPANSATNKNKKSQSPTPVFEKYEDIISGEKNLKRKVNNKPKEKREEIEEIIEKKESPKKRAKIDQEAKSKTVSFNLENEKVKVQSGENPINVANVANVTNVANVANTVGTTGVAPKAATLKRKIMSNVLDDEDSDDEIKKVSEKKY
jgi:hypothetical protein